MHTLAFHALVSVAILRPSLAVQRRLSLNLQFCLDCPSAGVRGVRYHTAFSRVGMFPWETAAVLNRLLPWQLEMVFCRSSSLFVGGWKADFKHNLLTRGLHSTQRIFCFKVWILSAVRAGSSEINGLLLFALYLIVLLPFASFLLSFLFFSNLPLSLSPSFFFPFHLTSLTL